ncbi:hypothetical protein B0T17DRAFT_507875 [Bombardia bombarda]|uniref:DUF676 domain-containing protein n=1 Tax=Bombardia bombarda TaxID=252184 RepID=A0AA39X069_9PEZI|nr:hypothetical protein B0T17DRAFT_507875 [Bombardia bombarda]
MHAGDLLSEITGLRSKTQTVGWFASGLALASTLQLTGTLKTERPLILIAHSIGGYVCQRALVRALNGSARQKEFCKHVRRLALIGTPFHSATADHQALWLKTGKQLFRLCSVRREPSFWQPDKVEKLIETAAKFLGFIKTRKSDSFEVACFYEGVATEFGSSQHGNRNGGTTDSPTRVEVLIADERAVRIPDCQDPIRLKGATHQGMVMVEKGDEPHFKPVLRELLEWAEALVAEEEDGDKARTQFIINFNGENRGLQVGSNSGRIEGIEFR